MITGERLCRGRSYRARGRNDSGERRCNQRNFVHTHCSLGMIDKDATEDEWLMRLRASLTPSLILLVNCKYRTRILENNPYKTLVSSDGAQLDSAADF